MAIELRQADDSIQCTAYFRASSAWKACGSKRSHSCRGSSSDVSRWWANTVRARERSGIHRSSTSVTCPPDDTVVNASKRLDSGTHEVVRLSQPLGDDEELNTTPTPTTQAHANALPVRRLPFEIELVVPLSVDQLHAVEDRSGTRPIELHHRVDLGQREELDPVDMQGASAKGHDDHSAVPGWALPE